MKGISSEGTVKIGNTLPKRTIGYPLILFFLLASCSGLERSEKQRIRKQNEKMDPIYRKSTSYSYPMEPPRHTPRSLYPWESEANLPKITKEFFRCKGMERNPTLQTELGVFEDCDGQKHGLPIVNGREGVHPILIELLNYLQKKTGRRVVVTSGYQCPIHRLYASGGKREGVSKHHMGAEVDFYVQGMEDRPLEILGLLMQFYRENKAYVGAKEYVDFRRQGDSKIETPPWFNKEISIKIYQRQEGRDQDNRHPYPYVSIQVQ